MDLRQGRERARVGVWVGDTQCTTAQSENGEDQHTCGCGMRCSTLVADL